MLVDFTDVMIYCNLLLWFLPFKEVAFLSVLYYSLSSAISISTDYRMANT